METYQYNLWYDIFDLLDFKSQLAFTFINSTTSDSFLYVTKPFNMFVDVTKPIKKYFNKITHVVALHDCTRNCIKDLSFVRNLKILHAQKKPFLKADGGS